MKKFIYRIKENEDINTLCKRFKINPQIFCLDNKITKIYGGLWVVINMDEYRNYVVKPNDSVDSICNRFLIDKEYFYNLNKISEIFIGELVKI